MTTAAISNASIENDACPECGGRHFSHDHQRGELVCERCGAVLWDNYIDMGPGRSDPESPYGSGHGDAERADIHDKGLGTDMGSMKGVSISQQRYYRKLDRLHRRERMKKAVDRSTARAFGLIGRWCATADIPDVVRNDTCTLYRRCVSSGLVRGRSCESIATGCLQIVCNKRGSAKTPSDIAAITGIDRKGVNKTAHLILRELGLGSQITSPSAYVPRFCSGLGLSPKVESRAKEVIDLLSMEGLDSGRKPSGIAAAAVRYAADAENEPRTQRSIAEISGVSEVTIRGICELIRKLDGRRLG